MFPDAKVSRRLAVSHSGQLFRPRSVVTAEISRAARGLLGWTQQQASAKIGISITTLGQFEAQESNTRSKTRALIELAYRNAGVTFVIDCDKIAVWLDRAYIVKKNAT